ncbi:MAG: prephenate dehydrogenase/arogenate dehydrogenase family protein [Coriobacteriales bacterium]|nr:prephenate dehydrogenase/arogenate dehydrogenase family protein [Coriobacteriales bacterium]
MARLESQSGTPFASVLIIGVGLIGGSVAAALKQQEGPVPFVRGIDVDRRAIEGALAKGYIDEGRLLTSAQDADLATWLADKDANEWFDDEATQLIVLAVPASGAEDWFRRIEASGYGGAITDVISTKGLLVDAAVSILRDSTRYIPGHPMAGSEVNGIDGARAGLFSGAHWILCPNATTDSALFLRLHEFVTTLGARSISLPREEHDDAIAIVSHVPHVVASALMQLAGEHAGERQELFRLAAGGFKDTTRIAAGSPELWCGIALDNQRALARGLAELKTIIGEFEQSISDGDKRSLARLLTNAAYLRSSIPATWVPDSAKLVELRIPMANHAGVIAEVTGFAGKSGCNIQSIDIDHINEASAILELILTDEGDIGGFSRQLLDGGYDFSLRPLSPQE